MTASRNTRETSAGALIERAMASLRRRIRTDPETGCHVVTGGLNHAGYGSVGVLGKRLLAHRVAYEAALGSIASGLQLDHLCRNRACCNPDHLEPVTALENKRRSLLALGRASACPKGHPYDAENTFYQGDGRRRCRACKRARDHRYKTGAST